MTRANDARGAVDGAATRTGVTETAPERQPRTVRLPALLVTMEAASLAIFSGLHLSGVIHVGGSSGAANGAGIVEALIGVVLLVAALTLIRRPGAGRRMARDLPFASIVRICVRHP